MIEERTQTPTNEACGPVTAAQLLGGGSFTIKSLVAPRTHPAICPDRLQQISRQLVFAGYDPVEAIASSLTDIDWQATEGLYRGEDSWAIPYGQTFLADVGDYDPELHGYRYYLLTYLTPPERYRPAFVEGDEEALAAWKAEMPAAAASGDHDAPLYTARAALNSVLSRVPLNTDKLTGDSLVSEAMAAWRRARPKPGEGYRRRLGGFWEMRIGSYYRVDMNFHERMSIMDFASGGLFELYPQELWEDPARSSPDTSKGDVITRDYEYARQLADLMSRRFEEASVLCSPTVSLQHPDAPLWASRPLTPGPPYDGRGRLPRAGERGVSEDFYYGIDATERPVYDFDIDEDGFYRPPAEEAFFPRETPTFGKHRVLAGLSARMPDQQRADAMIRRTETFMVFSQRVAELRSRLDDEKNPPARKEVLAAELAEHDELLKEITDEVAADPQDFLRLLISLYRERCELEDTLRAMYMPRATPHTEPYYQTLQISAGLSRLREMRAGEKGWYG